MTQYEVADILTQVLGRKITYAALEISDFMEIWKKTRFSAHNHQHIAAVAQDCRDGVFSGTNDVVELSPEQRQQYLPKDKEDLMPIGPLGMLMKREVATISGLPLAYRAKGATFSSDF